MTLVGKSLDAKTQKGISASKFKIEELTKSLQEFRNNIDLSPGDKVKTKAELSISDILKKLEEDLRDQRALAITFDISTLGEQAKLIEQAITDLVTKLNVSPSDSRIIKLKVRLADIGFANFQEALKKSFQNALKNTAGDAPIEAVDIQIDLKPKFNQTELDTALRQGLLDRIKALAKSTGKPLDAAELIGIDNLTYEGLLKVYDKLQTETDKRLISYQTAVSSFFTDFTSSIVDSFANAIESGSSIGGFFDGIFKSLAAGLVQLGKFFVKSAIQIAAIKKAIFTNPYVAVAAGIALIAIGAAIQNQYKKQAFAVGTRNAPGGMSLVGERGPELLNIPRGAQVVPAAQTAAMMGGMQSVEVFGMLRGQDIYFSNKKYGQTYNRQT
jgi:hypothetical protein